MNPLEDICIVAEPTSNLPNDPVEVIEPLTNVAVPSENESPPAAAAQDADEKFPPPTIRCAKEPVELIEPL